MGTNYYEIIDCCDKCGRGSEELHIGKSSMGWPFAIHVIPHMGLNSWKNWYERLSKGGVIKDEYGSVVSLQELDAIVIETRKEKDRPHVLECYRDYPNFKKMDNETGDQLCIGEFSWPTPPPRTICRMSQNFRK